MGAVNGFSILAEPGSEGLQTHHLDGRNRAIGFWSHVKQKIAVLAHDIHQQIDKLIGGDCFGFPFRSIVSKRASQAAALFPFGRADLLEDLIFRRLEVRMLDPETVVYDAIGYSIVILAINSRGWPDLG